MVKKEYKKALIPKTGTRAVSRGTTLVMNKESAGLWVRNSLVAPSQNLFAFLYCSSLKTP